MTTPSAILLDRLASLELEQSQPAPYDRPIGLRLLYQDPTSGAEHYLIRYPAGVRGRLHRHTAAHTIVVLEGRLDANGQLIGPGAYVHFPAGEPMQHQGTGDGPCLFVLLFHGAFDVEPLSECLGRTHPKLTQTICELNRLIGTRGTKPRLLLPPGSFRSRRLDSSPVDAG